MFRPINMLKNRKESYLTFLFMLISVDVVFIILDIANRFSGFISHKYLPLNVDHGYPEIYQYIKEFWIVILFFLYFLKHRTGIYFTFTLLFGYLLLDDALLIHEALGELFTNRFGLQPVFGLRGQDLGELVVFGIIGFVFLSLIVFGYFRSSDNDRGIVRNLLAMILVMTFFGVAVDMVHRLFHDTSLEWFWAVAEDGGEMLVMSVILWYVYYFYNRNYLK